MKEIQQVYAYLKGKLLNGEFEVLNADEVSMIVEVDGKYQFNLWVGSFDNSDIIGLYDWFRNFMHIEFNKAEKQQLHAILKPLIAKYQKKYLLSQKQAQLEKLQKEIECMNQQ